MIASTILLVAIVSKAAKLALNSTSARIDYASIASILLIGCETALAVLLLRGRLAHVLWFLAIASFTGFAMISGYAAITGKPSCGCFGDLRVPPLITCIVDCALLIAFGLARPKSDSPPRRRLHPIVRQLCIPALIAFMVGTSGSVALLGLRSWVAGRSAGVVAFGHTVVLEPKQWIGARFPLADEITLTGENGRALLGGPWLIVLYRHDCDHCRALLPRLQRLARERADQPKSSRIAFIEMPPYAPVAERLVSPSPSCAVGALSDRKSWFASTPVVMSLKNGVVLAVSEGDADLPHTPS